MQHNNHLLKHQLIQFVIMVLIGILFNPMNILAYTIKDIYFSLTLFYGGLLMASNMIWAHEIINFLTTNIFNVYVFCFGIILSVSISIFLLRDQYLVSDKQWLKRMISHHSTALTTSNIIKSRTRNNKIKELSNDIINTQQKEIKIMKDLLR